jgi:small ligand-binding sensory domain FIST
MSVFTSSHFASAAASGEDWRAASKKVLELLDAVKSKKPGFNIGFLYVSDHLSDDVSTILNLFRSVLGIENWVGTVGIGICGSGEAFIDRPAIAAMIGHIPAHEFCLFGGESDASAETGGMSRWLDKKEPLLVFVHGDPLAEHDPAIMLKDLERRGGGFLIGGLSSSRKQHVQFAGDISQEDFSGVAFSQDIKVATTLSQGCSPIGGAHTITRGDDHMIRELDGQKATEAFQQDLRAMAMHKIERDPDKILFEEETLEGAEDSPDEFKNLFKGEVHVAFPVSESDQKDYLVRNIVGIDPEEGVIVISQNVSSGDRIMFVHRDDDTVRQDLSRSLLELRERVQRETGAFAPKAALYVSCVARAFSHSADKEQGEMALIRDIIGDIPLAGFYAGGEICNARLYGYTGILTLFL